jgi:hypothetical protein
VRQTSCARGEHLNILQEITVLDGHINIGPMTIYGRNAMHWGVDIKTRWGFVCFRLPFRCFGRWWRLYLYVSPDATPTAATWSINSYARTSAAEPK